jgi:hypothetical protein
MNLFQLRPLQLVVVAMIIGVLIALIETLFKGNVDGTLLLTLTFWIAMIQGPVAVVATADISQGNWVKPLKKELLSFYPLILFMAFLFLFLLFQMDIYIWIENPHQWLNKNFFIIRNFLVLVISYVLAHFYAKASLNNLPNKNVLAVLYILSFILTQSLVAFDWIMSLEFPWMSTMFAPIFFMESFYAGLALTGIIAAIYLRNNAENSGDISKVMRDTAVFMFGFALTWAGLFYGQFLVIWYGNIPWETSFFGVRMGHSPYREMMYLIIIVLFIIPFLALLGRKIKSSGIWVASVSVVVIVGLLIERIFYILPVTSLNFFWFFIEFILMLFLLYLFFSNRDQYLKLTESKT